MHVLKSTLILVILFFTTTQLKAQDPFCPENSGFENGNFTNWLLYTGYCCPLVANTLTGPQPNRHVITNGGVDPYGGFPRVAPGGGNYSLKLGNNSVGSQAEKARFYVHVPAGTTNYSLIYRYAVVFEDPNHLVSEQPRFEVKAFDSATNQILPCANFLYISSSSLPGFQISTIDNDVVYKSWTTATLNLSGWEGHTIAVDFSTGDCALGAHFGYGYVDMSCGLFQIAGNTCGSATTTLTAPPGFQTYTWYNETFTTVVGSGQVTTINTPPQTSVYHVILTPYSGFGCPDTLTTTLNISNLQLTTNNDTTICAGNTVQLHAQATGNMGPFTYNWASAPGLSCTNCQNPTATPTTTTSYYVTATDTNNCSRMDTVVVNVVPSFSVATSSQPTNCYNTNTGSATATPGTPGTYTYSWSTNPVQTTQTATNLGAGTYTVNVTNSTGCTQTATVTVTQATQLMATLSTNPATCYGQNNGSASVAVSGGTQPYSYSWNTTPVQTSATATNLPAGPRTVTITDANGCTTTGSTTVSQPNILNGFISNSTNAPCNSQVLGTATASATGGTPPYTYSWNTTPVQTSQTATNLLNGTYIATITDANGCTDTAMVNIIQTSGLTLATTGTNVTCNGLNNGTATVTITNGVGPYTYSWSNGQNSATATNLAAGTYTINVSNNNGCTATATVTITQPAALNAGITNTPVNCYGQANGTASVSLSGGTPPYTYSWNTTPVQTTQTATNLSSGPKTVTVTDANGCTTTATTTINQPAVLDATISNSVNLFCGSVNTGSATVAATGGTTPYNYVWSTTPPQTGATANNLSAGTYTVTVTDAHGCTDPATVTITQTPSLSVTTSSTNVSCNGLGNGSASVTPNNGTPPFTYNWSNGQTTSSISNLSPGTYTATISDNTGCSATTSVTITQPSVLNAVLGNINNISCYGAANGSATIAVLGGSPPYSYSWSTTPVQTTAQASNLQPGSYTVVVTDSHGCTDNEQATITQPPVLDITIPNSSGAECGLPNGSATAEATGGTAPYSYSWNTTPVQTGSTANNLSGGTYTVTVTDSKGCTDNATITIGQTPAVFVNTVTDNASCYGQGNGSITTTITGGTQPITHTWSNNQTSLNQSNLSPGNYTIIVTDNNGCRDTSVATIAQPTLLNATVSGTDIKCFGTQDGAATVSVSGGTQPYSYQWNNGGTSANPNNLSAGTYTVVVTDANGCADTQSISITQPDELILTATALNSTCINEATGSAEAAVNGGTAPYSIVWSTTPQQTGMNVSGLAPGSYTVTLTDNNGCDKTTTVDISGLPLPVVNAGPDHAYCDGIDSIILTASGATSYQWTPPTSLTCSNCATTGARPNTTTTFTVVGTDDNGCKNSDEVLVTVYNRQPTATGGDLDICTGDTARLSATGGISYQWTPEPDFNDDSGSSPWVHPETSTTYSVIIVQNVCFSDTLQQKVSVYPRPTVTLGPDMTVLPGTVVEIRADTTNATSIAWNPVTNLSCEDCIKPSAKVDNTITYTATVRNKGCMALDEIIFKVSCDDANIFVANTFTPNSDGNNDIFFPQTPGRDMIKVFRVFNRWGQMVHEALNFPSNDTRYGWDGTYEGKPLSPDVFVYFLEATCPDGERVFKKGDVSLIK